MPQLVTQAAITFQPTDLRMHEQAGEQWLVAPRVAVRAMQFNDELRVMPKVFRPRHLDVESESGWLQVYRVRLCELLL